MRTIEELQSELARAVLNKDASGLRDELCAGCADPMGRLAIYQNNTRISLTNALIANFPVTVRLVDERFFRYAASLFIPENPPQDARLSEYGARLPRFLRSLPSCREVPFISDVATLEWVMSRCAQTQEEEALDVPALQEKIGDPGTVRIDLQPSLTFALTRYPAFEIWQSQQPGAGNVPVEITRSNRRYAASRMGHSVHVCELSSADYAFRRTLSCGGTVEAALIRALARDRLFDLVPALISLFRDGLVVRLRAEG